MRTNNNKVAGVVGSDPTLPDVELVVGGETYRLAYDFNAVVKAEEATGVNLLTSVMGVVTARSLRGLLWAALLKDKPDITIDKAGSLISPQNIPTIREAITTAWFGSVPKPGEGDDAGEVAEAPRE